jgi:hypothetical protein
VEECSKREARYSYGFWCCGSCIDSGGLADVVTVAHAVAASVTAAASMLAKVFWRSLSMSQVG